MKRAVAISLKIPDNTAYTTLVALRRLGVEVDHVERSEIRFFENADVASLVRRVEADETIFNPNKHRLRVLDEPIPCEGEVWIESLEPHGPLTAWRLLSASGEPAERAVVAAAVERLLCNPAIERAVTRDRFDRDNPGAGE